MSRMKGSRRAVPGTPMQIGLVANRPSLPRKGATRGGCPVTFTKCIETMPAATAVSA